LRRGVLFEPPVNEAHLLEVVEDPREGARASVGGAFEFVEPLFAVLEFVEYDKSPARPDLFQRFDDGTRPAFFLLVRGSEYFR